VVIHRSVADTNQSSFLRASTLRTLLAVAILAGAAGLAQAQMAPAATPLRVAVQVEPGSGAPMHDFLARSVVTGVKKGLRGDMPKGAVKVVDRDEPSDLLVKVSMRTRTLPPLKSQDPPRVAVVALSTIIDGRELVDSELSRFEFIGQPLGRDVATVLKLRTAVASSVVSDAAQLDVLIQGLSTRDAVERARIMGRLAALGPSGIKATSALIELLGDNRALRIVGPGTATTVGDEAARALVTIGATSALVDVLKSDPDDKARSTALSALARTYRADRSELIVAALADPAASVRRVAVYLARQAGPKAIPHLIDILLQKNDRETRNVARDALVKLSDQDFGLDGNKWEAWWATAKDKK